ncbi:uncharacterized protein LOC131229244 [Magnolia sinica]|uniref:uncharacterized protein LOC131229244 n=1 Tax=Magnolia sinica TaxID=86752 RepID=UPI002659A1E1|nr:uncharacterized protein LOC131229244 [Magnolia sinica]
MSFLAGRLACTEGAYFLQESKNAVGRLAQKLPSSPSTSTSTSTSTSILKASEEQADVLPEVLRHSLPLKVDIQQHSSFSIASKWLLQIAPPSTRAIWSSDVINPLRAYVSLPQVTFGPRRWQLPDQNHSVIASTANELRRDTMHTDIDSKKLKAAAAGLSQIGKAFAIATTIVFGGATLTFVLIASELKAHNSDDIRTKVRDLLQPKFEMVNEQLIPLREWAGNMSRKWHFEGEDEAKEKPVIIKELSKILGVRTPN